MTTIIMVAVGILIAAAAALALIFFGGSAFNGGADKAEAARLINEGVMIESAYQAFKAQEDREPGNGNGVDVMALKDLVCDKYLTHIPRGVDNSPPPSFDCSSSATPATSASPWKIDYSYGIARSVMGPATNADGSEAHAVTICRAARKQAGLSGDPQRCDAANISPAEPCCVMSAADAAA